jgi:hypothetical protein
MTEAELMMFHIELLNNFWAIIFTWVATTTAMLGAAYFVAARLKVALMLAMLGLYTLFSAACVAQLIRTGGRIVGVRDDLVALQKGGENLTHSASILISNIDSRLVAKFIVPLMLVVFFASIIYVIYCHKGGGAD